MSSMWILLNPAFPGYSNPFTTERMTSRYAGIQRNNDGILLKASSTLSSDMVGNHSYPSRCYDQTFLSAKSNKVRRPRYSGPILSVTQGRKPQGDDRWLNNRSTSESCHLSPVAANASDDLGAAGRQNKDKRTTVFRRADSLNFSAIQAFRRSGLAEQLVTLPAPCKQDARDYEIASTPCEVRLIRQMFGHKVRVLVTSCPDMNAFRRRVRGSVSLSVANRGGVQTEQAPSGPGGSNSRAYKG